MAKFKDGNAPASSTGEQARWEPLDLDTLKTPITVVTDDDQEDDKFNIEVEGDDVEEPKDLLSDAVEDHSERVPKGRAQERIIALAHKNKEKDAEIERLRYALQESSKAHEASKVTEVDARKKSTESLIEAYGKEYETAVMNGDVKAQAALTAKMTKANVELMALETFKSTPAPTQPQPQPTYTGSPREAVLQKLPEAGRKWAEKNKWFVTNSELTRQAVGIASEVEAEGFDSEDAEYYVEIEKRLAEMYPARFKKGPVKEEAEEVTEKVRPKQSPVAQSSRTTPTQKAGTVRLTREEVALAKKWRIPLERFAAEKKKVESAEKTGNRTTTIFE